MALQIFVIVIIIMVVLYLIKSYGKPSSGNIGSNNSGKNQTSTSVGYSGAIPVCNVINHWSKFFPSFSLSSDVFYKELEKTLQEYEIPNAVISRTNRKEGGMFSASREYLRIKHGDIVFEICAAPFGKSFFISWWLYETESTMRNLLKGTKMGGYLEARAARRTFYQIDEEEMFTHFVHECILEIVMNITAEKGVAQLTATEKMFKMGAA